MKIMKHFLLNLFVILSYKFPFAATASFNRSSFPSGFLFGTSSSSYQYEGAANEGGRKPSIWDTYTHKYPEKIMNGSNGDVAVDFYNRYKEDVLIMKDMNLDAFRFSISWSRILPYGKLSGGVNQEGVKFYNNLINELLAKGIQPFVTLFHWDLPQTLEDEYGGFLSRHIVNDFRDYADLCFKEFGDRVMHWITLNEPWAYSVGGYASGKAAPGRCSEWQMLNCTGGNSSTEPYIVSHYQLLAHATVVELYRQTYQASQNGTIGISLSVGWMLPFAQSEQDRNATLRAIDFNFGWYMDPLTNGDYPHTMRSLIGNRLPEFTNNESKMVKGSFDFLGLNYYTSSYAIHAPNSNEAPKSVLTDSHTNLTSERNEIPIGPVGGSGWVYSYPKGIRDMLHYTKTKYNNPVIYITENGIDELSNLPIEEALVDHWRIEYHHHHLSYLLRAIRDNGVDLRGYFVWSFLDNFEWGAGYHDRFGIYYIDYNNNLQRHPKLSATWFKNFLHK